MQPYYRGKMTTRWYDLSAIFTCLCRLFSHVCVGYFHMFVSAIFKYFCRLFSHICVSYFHIFVSAIFTCLCRLFSQFVSAISTYLCRLFSHVCVGYFHMFSVQDSHFQYFGYHIKNRLTTKTIFVSLDYGFIRRTAVFFLLHFRIQLKEVFFRTELICVTLTLVLSQLLGIT